MSIAIGPHLQIEPKDYWFEYARASGPGGQHVNKVETRATLCFVVDECKTLSDNQKWRIKRLLAGRISAAGILRVTSRRHRSRAANVKAATQRFAELIAAAIQPPKPRKPTQVTRGAKKRRLEAKRRLSQLKSGRRRPSQGDE